MCRSPPRDSDMPASSVMGSAPGEARNASNPGSFQVGQPGRFSSGSARRGRTVPGLG